MNDIRYILKEPIEIKDIGTLYPMDILKYNKCNDCFSVLAIVKSTLLQQVDTNDKEKRDYIENNVKNFDVLCSQRELIDSLINLISVCFEIKKENIQYDDNLKCIFIGDFFGLNIEKLNQRAFELININKDNPNDLSEEIKNEIISINDFVGKLKIINKDNYDFIRNSIIKMYGVHLPKQAKTLELQKWFNKASKAKGKNNKTDMEDIITTIVAVTGIEFDKIKAMSMYQINKLIERINKVKEYDVNVQFLCVGAKDIKLTSYLEHLDNEREEKLSVPLDELSKSMGMSGVD